jgi:hypothetical protein
LHRKIWVKSSLTALSLTEFSGPEGTVTKRPSFSTVSNRNGHSGTGHSRIT